MNPDYLPLLAEIGAALAGFGALLGLIGAGASTESPEVDAGRLRGMLERALAVVLLALLPMALGQFPLSEDVVWRACAAILLIMTPWMHRSQFLRLQALPNYSPGRAYLISGRATVVLQVVLLATGFAGVVPLPAAYGLALLAELSVAGNQFLRVVASITSRRA